MFKFSGQRKLFLGMVLIVTALMLQFSTVTLAAPNSKSVEMSVSAGYDDVVRIGADASFHITIVNKGDGFSGEAQVIVDTSYRTKTAYAMPFELPQGSTKKLTLNVPVNTANRKVQVKIESNGRSIKEIEYSYKNIMSPGTPVIGVLSDAYNQLRILNGLKIEQNQESMDSQNRYGNKAIYKEEMQSVFESPVQLIQLNKDNLPENFAGLAIFDYIIIADYDTSLLSEKQVQALEEWVDDGNELILAGGTNGKKVYSGLSNSLKPFEILGSKKASVLEGLLKLTEKSAPADLVDISTGNLGAGKILIGDEITPLAVSYKKTDGKILFIAFDPTLSPISEWGGVGEMWKRLLNENLQANNIYPNNGTNYHEYRSVVSQVPEDQTPPYKALLAIIFIYILIVGPLLYLLLKWKDKRDYTWILIPVMAFLCIGIIYAAGFRTRYTSAVLNNFSIIHLDSENKKADIQTSAGAFNNGSGKMMLEYSNSYEVEVLRENDYDYGYNYNYSDEDYKNAQIKSKIYLGEPIKHELYNVGLWEPCILKSNQTQNYDGNLIENISINGKEFSAVIRNDTGFAFEDSFIVVGENYIDVGDILPTENKKITLSLDDKGVKKSYSQLLDSRYFNINNLSTDNWPKDWKEQLRRRNALDNMRNNIWGNMIYGTLNSTKITFVALNFENVEYGIKVNGKKAKTYNTNVVVATEDLFFVSGKKIEISEGLIGAVFEGGDNVDYNGRYDEGIMVYTDTDAFYRFDIPKDIIVDKFKIDWSTSIPEYLKDKYTKNGAVEEISAASYELFIYNNVLADWEIINEVFETKGEVDAYINGDNAIKIKVRVNMDETIGGNEFLWKPEISLSGVKE